MIIKTEIVKSRYSKKTVIVLCDDDGDPFSAWNVNATEDFPDELTIENDDKPQNWASFERDERGVWSCDSKDTDYDDALFDAIAARLNADGLPPWEAKVTA